MQIATLAEINILDFWELTPAELELTIKAYNENKKEKQEERLILTWLGAAWQRSKKMPDIKKILNKTPTQKKMTDEEMLEQVKKINIALGGEYCGNN